MISGLELEDPCFDHNYAIYLLGESQAPYLEAGGWCAVASGLSSVQCEGNQAKVLPALGPLASFPTGAPLRCYRHWSHLLGWTDMMRLCTGHIPGRDVLIRENKAQVFIYSMNSEENLKW